MPRVQKSYKNYNRSLHIIRLDHRLNDRNLNVCLKCILIPKFEIKPKGKNSDNQLWKIVIDYCIFEFCLTNFELFSINIGLVPLLFDK